MTMTCLRERLPSIFRLMACRPEINRGLLEQFLVDSEHSNAFAAWKKTGSPKSLSAGQQQQLETAGNYSY